MRFRYRPSTRCRAPLPDASAPTHARTSPRSGACPGHRSRGNADRPAAPIPGDTSRGAEGGRAQLSRQPRQSRGRDHLRRAPQPKREPGQPVRIDRSRAAARQPRHAPRARARSRAAARRSQPIDDRQLGRQPGNLAPSVCGAVGCRTAAGRPARLQTPRRPCRTRRPPARPPGQGRSSRGSAATSSASIRSARSAGTVTGRRAARAKARLLHRRLYYIPRGGQPQTPPRQALPRHRARPRRRARRRSGSSLPWPSRSPVTMQRRSGPLLRLVRRHPSGEPSGDAASRCSSVRSRLRRRRRPPRSNQWARAAMMIALACPRVILASSLPSESRPARRRPGRPDRPAS